MTAPSSRHLVIAPAAVNAPGAERPWRQPSLLTITDAASVLNVPESWLRKKVSARQVPFTLIGRHVRFTADHLDQIVASGQQRPVEPVVGQGVSRRARVRS